MTSNSTEATTEPRAGTSAFWRLIAVLNIVTIAWVIYVVWQISPDPVVNEFVTRRPSSPPGSGAVSGAVPPAAPQGMSDGTGSPPSPGSPPLAPLKMETELTTKVVDGPAAPK